MGAIFAGLLKFVAPLATRATMIGLGIALLSGGALYAGCSIKSCIEAKQELQQYHRADEVRKEDPKVDKNIEEQKKRVDQMATPDDFDLELKRLRHHGADSDE